MYRRFLALSLICAGYAGCAAAQGPNAVPAYVFGPQEVTEPAGPPAPVSLDFGLAPLVHGPYSVVVLNPDKATGTISLNGETLFPPRLLPPIAIQSQAITLGSSNTLTVELDHGPGAKIWVAVLGWEYAFANEYPAAPSVSVAPFAYPNGSLDWAEKGAVTGVKNQGAACPASWAFSATGALEGFVMINHGTLTSLSEQELIDCSPDLSCLIGSVPQAMTWDATHGDTTEAAYPYTGKRACGTAATTPGPYTEIPALRRGTIGSENALGAMVDAGPVSAVINGNWFATYSGGVATPNCEAQIPSFYGVLIVGYGEDTSTGTGIPYWLVKTSLGTAWGEQGYFRIARGQNLCGIADYIVMPSAAD